MIEAKQKVYKHNCKEILEHAYAPLLQVVMLTSFKCKKIASEKLQQ